MMRHSSVYSSNQDSPTRTMNSLKQYLKQCLVLTDIRARIIQEERKCEEIIDSLTSGGLEEYHLFELTRENDSTADTTTLILDNYNRMVIIENDIINSIEDVTEFLIKRCRHFQETKGLWREVCSAQVKERRSSIPCVEKRVQSADICFGIRTEVRSLVISNNLLSALEGILNTVHNDTAIASLYSKEHLSRLQEMNEHIIDLSNKYSTILESLTHI